MNRAGRVIALLWITFACCTGSYADDGDGQECSIVWEIVQIQTYDLVLRWSGDDSAQDSTVQLKFNAVSVNTTTCPATLGETNAGFSDQQLELNLLCPNTQYTLNIIFHCTENSTTIWTPPGSPVNVTIPDDDVTNTSFAVSWFAPPGLADILYTVNVNGTLFVKETVNTNIWYTDLRPFTNYSVEVAAKNKDFPGRPSPTVEVQTKAGTPGPPRLLSVSSTASSLSLAWEDPEPSGVPIESFEVQWRTATGDFGSHTTAEKSFTIESLTPYTNYTVRVRAKTYLGEGEWTDEIDHSTEIGIPHQPQNFEEVSRTNTSIYLEWEEPKPPTGPILCYGVWWSGGAEERDFNVTETFFNVTGLKPYTKYKLKTSAFTEAGGGQWTEVIEVQTGVGVPSAPTGLEVRSSTDTSLLLAWKDPEPFTGPIEDFEVEWTNSGDPQTDRTKVNSYNVTGLVSFTPYKLRVRARTSAGEGPWSEYIVNRTAVGVPNPPRHFLMKLRTNTSLYFEWAEPEPHTGPILSYSVLCTGSSESESNTSNTFLNVTGLTPFTDYSVKARAHTEAGPSQWTKTLVFKTDIGVPHSPRTLNHTLVTNTSVTLIWLSPVPSTGPISTYVVKWNSSRDTGSKDMVSNRTEHTISGLLPYLDYVFQVQAVTTAGQGEWSHPITLRTDIGVPHAPTTLNHTSITNTSVVLSWSEPSPSTGPISTYVAQWRSPRGAGLVITNSNRTTQEISGLVPYVNYTFQMMAETRVGRGAASDGISVETCIGVPHAPTTLTQTLFTNTSVALTWREPVPSTGPVLTYILLWSSSRGTSGQKDTGSSITSHVISELLPCVKYTFQVLAVTSAGRGAGSNSITVETKVGVPHEPTALRRGTVTNTSVSLIWKEPSPSTGSISTYVVKWSSPRGDGQRDDTRSNASSYVVNGLLPFVQYTFRVLAVTSAGSGKNSDSIVVQTEVGVPHAPTTLTQTLFTNTSVALTWREPVPSTGPVLTYILLWSSSRGTSGQKDTGSSITSHVISELLPCVKYTFQVLAVTSAGRGAGSNSITVETKVGVPHEPTALRRGTVTNTSVSLIWKEPSPSTGSISTYVVKWSSPRGDGQRDDTRSNASSYVVNGLLPFVQYTFRVLAVTSAGSGKNSDSIVVQTEVGVPHAPQALTNTSAKNTSIALAWQEPDPSTGPITTYIVRWSSDKGADGERDTRSSELRYEFSGLHPFRDYTFQVQAMTVAGKGEWSDDKTVRTDIGIPTVPLNLMQERLTDVSVTIRWDQPQFPNGPDLGYEIQLTLASSDANGTDKQSSRVHSNQRSVQHMISGLLPYTHYSVRVAAVTGLGCGQWTDILLFQTLVGAPKPAVLKSVAAQGRRAVLVQWSTVGPYPGPVDYSLQAWMGPGRCSSGTSSYIHAKERKGDMGPEAWKLGIQRNTVTDLSPYGIYHFLIVLRTSATDGIESEQSEDVRMAPEAAAEPTDVTSNCHFSSTKARVSWMPPKQPNGIIDSYDIEYSMDSKWRTVNVPVKDPCAGRSHVLTGLRPERPYKIKVYAWVKNVTSAGKSALSKGTCILPAGIPSVSNTSRLLAKGTGSDHVILEWTQDTFSDFMGSIVYYAVLVGRRDALGNATSGTSIDKGPPWSNFSSGFSDFYQATPPFWNPFNQEPDPLLCVSSLEAGPDGNHTLLRCLVGAQDVCPDNETYCNGPLLPDTQYEMKIRAFTRGGYTETDLIYTQTGPKPRGSAVGAVVTVIVVLLLVASLVAGGYVMKKKGYLPTLMNTFQKRIRSRRKESAPKPCVESSMEHLERCTSPRPIKSRHFADHVRTMMSDSHLKFSLEFEIADSKNIELWGQTENGTLSLRPGRPKGCRKRPILWQDNGNLEEFRQASLKIAPHFMVTLNYGISLYFTDRVTTAPQMLKNESPHPPCNVAEMDENRFKNRWMNIFPFDHSRVKLLPLSDEPGSDFINANYIPGYSSRREYIATQGPLPHTVDDFWRMLWEQSVSMVVMLTQCVERGKKKCEQYWPESGEARYYGDMRVGTVSESMLSCYVIRIFHVQLGSHERRIKQMHFTHWPDFGCPESPEDLVNFVRAVRDHLPRHEPGPILVHCSAGVGRTGTFIAVDRLAQQLSYRHIPLNDLVDIYGSVLDLRNHRTNMVQTEDQYIYIHLCVRELIWERDTPTEKESEDLVYSNIGVQRDTGV